MDQSNFTKWFRSEVAAAFAIGVAVAGSLLFLMSPIAELKTQMAVLQNTVAELKSNDLVHIELEVTKNTNTLDEQQAQLIDTNNKVIEILTILRKK